MRKISIKCKVFVIAALALVMTLSIGLVALSKPVKAANSLDTAVSTFAMEGQGVRLSTVEADMGMRFVATFSKSDYQNLFGENSIYKSVEFGYVAMPKYYEDNLGDISVDTVFGEDSVYKWDGKEEASAATSYTVIHHRGIKPVLGKVHETSEEKYLVKGSVVDMFASNLATKYTARMYIRAVLEGETEDVNDDVVEYKFASEPVNNLSMIDIAIKSMDDGIEDASLQKYIDRYVEWYKAQNDQNEPSYSYTVNYFVNGATESFSKNVVDGNTINSAIDISESLNIPEGYVFHSANVNNKLSGKVYADNNLALNVYVKNSKTLDGELKNNELYYFEKTATQESNDIILSKAVGSIESLKIGNTVINDFTYDDETKKLSVKQSEISNLTTGDTSLTIETIDTVYTGKVTVADYIINTAEEFMMLQTAGEVFGATPYKHYILGNDIENVSGYINKDANLFRGVLDGKGYAVKNLTMGSDSHALFSQTSNTAIIRNIAFINISYVSNHKCAILVNQNRGLISNVFVSGVSNGVCGFVNTHAGVLENCIADITYVGDNASHLANPAMARDAGAVKNCYAITNYTGGIAAGAEGGAVYASKAEALDAFNSKVPDNYDSVWSFNSYGNLMYDDEFVVKYEDALKGTLKDDELFYFSKDVSTVTGYASKYVSDGYYTVTLPAIEGEVYAVSVAGVETDKVSTSGNILKIPTNIDLTEVSGGIVDVVIKTTAKDYSAKATVADYAVSTETDLFAVLPIFSTGYAVLTEDITCTSSYTRPSTLHLYGTWDGKGYAVKNLTANNHLFTTMQSGATICNIAFLKTTYTAGAGFFSNETAGGITFENVLIVYSGNGAGGLICAPQGSFTVKDTVVVCASTTYGLCRNYKAGIKLTLDNSYFVTTREVAVETDSGETDTTNFYETANAAVCADLNAFTTKSNNYAQFDSSVWSIKEGSLLFGDEIVVKKSNAIVGEKNNGELFYFSKNVDTVAGYSELYVSEDKYNVTLPIDIENIDSVAIGGTNINGFSYVNKVLSIPVSALSNIAAGDTQLVLSTKYSDYVANVTVANYVMASEADLNAVLPLLSNEYVVLDGDITCSGRFSRETAPDFSGTWDGKGYAIKKFFLVGENGIFNTLQNGSYIKNLAFLSASYSEAAGWFANQTASGIKFENVAIVYAASGGGGIIGSPQGGLSVKDTIVVCASTTYGLCNTYKGGVQLTLTNSYFVTARETAVKTDAGDADTTNFYETANAAVCADITALKTKSNNLANFDSSLWSIDASGNICFGDEIIISAS